MSSTVRNILIVVLIAVALILIWKRCGPIPPGPDPPPNDTIPGDTTAGGDSYPVYPESGEKNDVIFNGSTVMDRPCMYVFRGSNGRFKVIDIVIPHDDTHKWQLATGSPTVDGTTLVFTFEEVATPVDGRTGVSVYVDPTNTRQIADYTHIRAVAAKDGGGSDDDIVVVGGTDDESLTPTWSQGIPFIWNKATTEGDVVVGGFVYGLDEDVVGTIAQAGTTYVVGRNTGTGRMFQTIPIDTLEVVGTYRVEVEPIGTDPARGVTLTNT